MTEPCNPIELIAAIELGLVGELRNAAGDGRLGYLWGTLESYPDDFDDYLEAEMGMLRFPAAWAVFLGLGQGVDNDDETGWNGEATFALVVAAQNNRGETETRHGGQDEGKEPGSYRLMLDAVRILSRNELCLPLTKPIEVTGARPVARSDKMRKLGLSLIAISLKCTVPFGRYDDEGDIAEFLRFHADWDVPPIGNVVAPLPAADPDAEDMVELPQ